MNIQTQSKQIAPSPSWKDFGYRDENRTFVDRDSKFLFHYEKDPFDIDYEELQDFPADEYENTQEESTYKTYTHKSKSKRKQVNTNEYRKKRHRKEEGETQSKKKYIGQPEKNKLGKRGKGRRQVTGVTATLTGPWYL